MEESGQSINQQSQLFVLLREALQEAKLTEEEIELVYYCHLYAASQGRHFVGHELIMVVYKLVAYIAEEKSKGRL